MYRRRNWLALAAVAFACLGVASTASAATVTVNTTADQNFVNDPFCSLREAIALTNADGATSANGCAAVGTLGADTINFSPALDGAVLQLTTVADGELLVTDADGLTISGPGSGAGHLIIKAATAKRVIESTGGVPLTLNDLSVEEGFVSDSTSGGASASGGGIRAAGDLTLNRVLVRDNAVTVTASGSGNASAGGGGVDATNGTLTITDSEISNNSATADNPLAAGNDGNATAQGGGVWAGNGTISNSTISANTASAIDEHAANANDSAHTLGGGVAGSALSIHHSTVSGNLASSAAPEGGAGDSVIGGGIFINGHPTLIELSTIAGNQTTVDANGADIGGGIGNFDALTLDSDTIASNGPASGDSASANLWPNGTMALKNTIVADPRGAGSTNCGPPVTSNGFNIDSDNSCGISQPTDQINVNPVLGSLQDNSGPTFTMLPASNSPAIDKGTSAGQTDSSHDQRFLSRPVNSVTVTGDPGDGSDVGAVEAQAPATPTVDSTSPASPSNTVVSPHVIGTVSDAGTAEGADSGSSGVHLYGDSSCASGLTSGTGTPGVFSSPGIQPALTANTTTTIYARTFNTYGIPSPCSSTFKTYEHDSLGPVMSIDSGPTDPTNHSAVFTFHGTDVGGSTPLSFQCSLDTGTASFSACISPFTSALLPDGTYTFRVKGADSLTNVGSSATQSFTIATPSPSPTPTPSPSPSPTPSPTPTPKKHCKKGQKLKHGKCVKHKK